VNTVNTFRQPALSKLFFESEKNSSAREASIKIKSFHKNKTAPAP
jgi:hypothetical protein